MQELTATYSPDDNKLRLYANGKLPPDIYEKVKAAGFKWAPKQELFVAPMWTPQRADLLEELCGEIGDEDTSLVDRAAIRSERFEEYSDKRATEAARAQEQVEALTNGIPLGQPILIGHHSEKHARKHAEKIKTVCAPPFVFGKLPNTGQIAPPELCGMLNIRSGQMFALAASKVSKRTSAKRRRTKQKPRTG